LLLGIDPALEWLGEGVPLEECTSRVTLRAHLFLIVKSGIHY
jgi:hypothetical protein